MVDPASKFQYLIVKPRILYVLSCWPHDRSYGGQLRALHLARALAKVGHVTLAIVGADPVDDASKARTAAEFPIAGAWDIEPTGIRGIHALWKALTDRDFVNVHGLALNPSSEKEIQHIAREHFDLVWFFKLRTANYFRQARWPGFVVDVDDVPSSATGSQGNLAGGWAARTRGWILTRALRLHEKRLKGRFDVLAVCSAADRTLLGGDPAIRVIPNGFERPVSPPERRPSNPSRIGFIGLLDYEPNRDGVRWFLENCWPTLREAVPGLVFRLAGKGAEEVLLEPVPGVEVLGWVEDAASEIATWSLMVIPIRSGAGTRIKIADTFSRQCPAVSTRLGAYGYNVEDGWQLRLADTPEDFTRACWEVLQDPDGARAMAERAWQEFLEKWTWEAIEPKVWEAAEAAIKLRHRQLDTPAL
jgi:glycosyltransferase involved in cell wall biosynthesis